MKRMKRMLMVLFLVGMVSGYSQEDPHTKSGLKKVIVQEILQVESYTYLNVLEDGNKIWLAVPKREAKIGEIYYYKGGMKMPQFRSNELNKTFDEVIFLGAITSAEAINLDKGMVDPNAPKTEKPKGKKPTLSKLELDIPLAENGIRISELFENKEKYNGKKIRIRGEVTKFSAAIMNRNWAHFQDGTIHEGAFDLMITTNESLLVGDVVIFEGTVAVDKDFGAGYFYKVILEDAIVVK